MRPVPAREPSRLHAVRSAASERLTEHWQRTLVVTFIAQTLCIFGFAFVTPFLPLFVQKLGIHGAATVTFWAALMSAFVAVGMAVSAPFWGVLADRYGRKLMLLRAAGTAAIIIGLTGIVANVYQLLFLRLMGGIFTGTVSASQALVASQTPRRRLGFALGVMQTAIFVGNSMGPLAGGITAELLGFRPTFAVAGGLLLVATILVFFFVHEDKESYAEPAEGRPTILGGMREVLVMPALLPTISAIFAVQFAVTQVYPVLPQFVQVLQGKQGNAAAATGLIFAGAGIAGAISSTSTGWFSDRFGHRRMLATAALVACAVSVPQFFVQATWQLLLLRIVDGFALGSMLPAASAILAGLVPAEKRGAAYGISAAATSLGFAAGPLTSALVVAVSEIRAVFLVAAVLLALVGAWVTVMVPDRDRERLQERPAG